MFTPKLAEFYNAHHKEKNLEIVFISSDRDESSFDHYFGPTFVLLDKDGNTISTKARESVMADPAGVDFPWRPKSIWELLRGELQTSNGQRVDAETHLKSKAAFGVYFSAHWCGPCRQFTPVLTETYKTLKSQDKAFEVVFVSADNDQHEFDEYFGSMPWSAIPYTDKKRIDALNQHFEVEGIPHFVLLDGPTGGVISKNGRGRVETDRTGNEFPWHPKALNTVDVGASEINDFACLMYINSDLTEAQIKTLEKVATEYANKWKGAEPKMLFMYGKDSPMTTRVKSFTNVPNNTLFVLNIPDGNKTVQEAGKEFTEENIKHFIEAFLSGSLKPKGIKD